MQRGGPLRYRSTKTAAKAPARREVNEDSSDRADTLCQLRCSPDCLNIGNHSHEVMTRAQLKDAELVLDNCLWTCWPCNQWAHGHPILAAAYGILHSKKHPFNWNRFAKLIAGEWVPLTYGKAA